MNTNFDVLICGMGPTGATLAGLLGQRGVRVAVFDRLPDLYPLPRAIGLDHEAMRIMQELGVAERIAPYIADYRPSVYLGMDGQMIKRLDTLPPPHPLSWSPNYVFNQPAFERTLRARLQELDTVEAHVEAEVTDSGQDDTQVWLQVRLKGHATPVRFTGQYLVACDGGSSPIRKRLGILLEDLGFDEPWLVVDAEVPDGKLQELPQTMVQYCEAARPATFVVGPGNHRRWEIMLEPGESTDADFPDEKLWPLLSRWIRPGEARLMRRAAYRFHGLLARAWRQGRTFLAGDAAHMTPPFMAQGMVQGLRDAHNLAWKLDRVLHGRSPDRLLDTYFEERSPHVRQTTLAAMDLGRVICERDPAKARARDAALLAEQGAEVKTTYRQQMIPGLTGGAIAAATPAAGTVFPQPLVRCEAGTTRLDDLAGNDFLVVVDGFLPGPLRPDYLTLAARIGARIIELAPPHGGQDTLQITERDTLLRDWFRAQAASVAVVRPDRYTFGTARTLDEGLNLLKDCEDAVE